MLTRLKSLIALASAPLILAVSATPAMAQASSTSEAGADASATEASFEETIGQAKSLMMANSAQALELSRKAKGLVEGDGPEARESRLTAQWLEAEALMRLNRADEAAELINLSLEAVSKSFPGSKLHADLVRSKGSLSVLQGEFGDALQAFLEAHDLYEALGEDRSRAIVLQNIGSLHSDARDYERVLSYYAQASEAYPEDPSLELSSRNNIGNALKELGRYKEAEEAFLSALELASQMGSPLLEARILTNVASTQFLAGDYAKAERTVQSGLRIAHTSAPEWQPFLYGVRAQIALADGKPGRAKSFLERAFVDEDLTQTSPYFRDFHETAYTVYSNVGDYRLAAQHLAAFHRIDGQAREISATANNALLAARFDAENRDLLIANLSAEKEVNEARLDIAQNRVWLLSGAVAMVIFAFIATLFVLRTVNRSRRGMQAANEKLTHVIQHDTLTELFSRDHFRVLLEDAIRRSDVSEQPNLLAFIDLDRFKQVNDVFGHAVGDKLLQQVAERFRVAAGENSMIGRLGGDEFALLLPDGYTLDQGVALAQRIIDDVAKPFEIDDFDISIGASIGIAELKGVSSSSVHMTNADLALYVAKDRGRGNCVVYDPSMREKLEDRSSLEKDLEKALEAGELSVSYQPIVRPNGDTVMGYEALLRWTHPKRGSVPPEVFIPVAEDSRLIERLGEWVLREACTEAAGWPDDRKLTVNVSTIQMSDPRFLTIVAQALAQSGLAPGRLVLELTESLVLEMDEQTEAMIEGLRKLGVSFALDDFGRGYSSLNYIEKMDFSMIKIDREFVQSAAAGLPRSQAVVVAIVALAQSLDIDVAAEGIEMENQAQAMVELGCTCFQGFYFGRPGKIAEIGEKERAAGSKRAAA